METDADPGAATAPEAAAPAIPAAPPSSSCPSAPSRWRVAGVLAGGALAIYLATWVGAAAFYWYFHQPLLAQEADPERSILWFEPTVVDPPPEAAPGWGHEERDGCRFPTPPGTLLGIDWSDSTARLKLAEGELSVHCRSDGFVASVFAQHLASLGLRRDASRAGDALVLDEVLGESVQDYEFAAPDRERRLHAARLITKMAVWDVRPLRRLDLARAGASRAALVEYAAGDVQVIVATERGTLVVEIAAGAPAAWKSSAADWLR